MNDTAQTVGIAALAFGILRVLERAVTGLLDRKNGNGQRSSQDTAGNKSPEYWEKRYDAIDNAVRALTKDVAVLQEWLRENMTDVKSALSTLIRWKGGD